MKAKKQRYIQKLKGVFLLCCVLIISTFQNSLFGQNQEEDLQEEIQKYTTLSQKATDSPLIFYQLAQKGLDLHLLRKKNEMRYQDTRFKNFGTQLDTLKTAYFHAQKALQLYRKNTKEECNYRIHGKHRKGRGG